MTTESFHTSMVLPASPQEVFDQICDVRSWWSRDFEGNSKMTGDEFVICHTGLHYTKQRLTEVVPGSRLVWLVTESELSWLEHDKQEWKDTRMVFDLSAAGDATLLRFTHEGLVPGKECYERCTQGWTGVLQGLKTIMADKKA